jgi:uncharacterized phage infection (PIP) family protein YhgE
MSMESDNFRKAPDSLPQAADRLRNSHERATLGLTYDDLLSFIQRLELVARTHNISHEKLLQQVIDALEQMDQYMTMDALVGVKREELAQLEEQVSRGVSRQQAETDRLIEIEILVEAKRQLFDALEQMDQYMTMDALVGVKREELAQLEEQVNRGVSRQQAETDRLMDIEVLVEDRKEELAYLSELVNKYNAEADRLRETASALQQDLERLSQLQSFGELAHDETQKAGEEAAASVRDMAQLLRGELDRLLKEIMDLAGKAAQIDADLRSHEWLNRLLMLVEGRDDIKPAEVRHLAITIMRSVSRWLDHHQQEPLSGSQRDLQRLLNAFQEWQT